MDTKVDHAANLREIARKATAFFGEERPEILAAANEIERLEGEHDAVLEADAMRYRWLRDIGDSTWLPLGKRPGIKFSYEIDAAIDAALKRSQP